MACPISHRFVPKLQPLQCQRIHADVTSTTSSPWYEGKTTFRGPLLRDVLALANFKSDTIGAKAVNDYRISIPYEDVVKFNVVLAHTINGERLTIRTRGPLFVIYPFDKSADLRVSTYYARCIWQLIELEEQ